MSATSPKPIRSIVAATDFSAHALKAVERAGVLAQVLDARLRLLHVMDPSPLARARDLLGGRRGLRAGYTQSAKDMLKEAITVLPRAVRPLARSRVAMGEVLDQILRAANRHDLLVLGARGGSPLRDLILGSTAERLLQKGGRPMLVVKRAAKHPYRRVVVGFDFSPDSTAALDSALRVAPDARITLVHAYEAEFERMLWRGMVSRTDIEHLASEARRDALIAMHRVAAGHGEHAARIDWIVVRGYPPRVILDAAVRRHADLIAVGKHGRTALERMLIGSRTRHILVDSRCDVLIARRRAR